MVVKLKFKKFGEINFENMEKFYRDFTKTLFFIVLYAKTMA